MLSSSSSGGGSGSGDIIVPSLKYTESAHSAGSVTLRLA